MTGEEEKIKIFIPDSNDLVFRIAWHRSRNIMGKKFPDRAVLLMSLSCPDDPRVIKKNSTNQSLKFENVGGAAQVRRSWSREMSLVGGQ
jgi:hypothetical protein